ncbi:hypothetical protein [Nesterenkonia muleiensis]|uniref:hypothetical protein n=1 Tax=Nesterenkonia muleiensis TaxID=2282648 RepID=UPI000E71FE12|nr:hypothetical protein [Nesterenkonia muleiensis]
MLLLAAILTIVGAGDALRVLLRGRVPTAAGVAGLASLALIVLWGAFLMSGSPWWLTALCLLPVLIWFLSVPVAEDAPGRSIRTAGPRVLGFLLLAAVLTVLGEELAEPTDRLSFPERWPFSPEFAVLAVGIGLFHGVSANALVRLALRAEGRGSRQRTGRNGQDALLVERPQLKGGRWIGPLERIALTGLLVAGAYPVAAGLIAAKGIVRFPEMQEDRAEGNKAEYFLVGSFVSWTMAILCAGLLWTAL